MTTLNDIEDLAQSHRADRDTLLDMVDAMEDAVSRIRDRHMEKIRPQIAVTAESGRALADAIEGAPELFARPKTQTFSGLRVGFRKQPGTISFKDPELVVKLIRKHLDDRAASLIRISETPDKNALGNLTAVELKKIGCTVTDDTDVVVVKAVESDAEKAVSALLKDAEAA